MAKTEQCELVPRESAAVAAHSHAGSSPADMLAMVAARGATPEELAKWMDLNDRWQAGEARKAFAAAMSDFQSRVPAIVKTREVKDRSGRGMYKFANCDDITQAIRPIERDCGFFHRFEFEPQESGALAVACVVTHISGHSERTRVVIPATKGMNTNSAQDAGIMQQYGMRYALVGAFGITTGSDDTDANSHETQTLDAAQIARVGELVRETGADARLICEVYAVSRIEDIPAACFAGVESTLLKKRAKARKPAEEALPL